MIRFPFDPDVTRAETPPARLYTDPVWLELESDRIFARTWQLVGRTELVGSNGSYFTADIGRESLVIVRDGDTLRGFHNVCLHRAGPVAHGTGCRKTMQCKYHGWTYSLGGQLLHAPEMEGTSNFDPANFRLQPVQVATWGPLVFANLDNKAPAFSTVLEDIPERAARFAPERMTWVMRRDYDIACNWKVYVDNYLEGYHIPVVHPTLHKEIDYEQYQVEPRRYYSLQHAPLRPLPPSTGSTGGSASDRKYTPQGSDDQAQYYWLFPNTMLNIYQGQMQTNVIIPLGPDRTRTVFEWYATEPPANVDTDPRWQQLVQFSDDIQQEDVEICEVVQKNLHSRVYDRGRYSAKRENGVHHFHALLHEFLT